MLHNRRVRPGITIAALSALSIVASAFLGGCELFRKYELVVTVSPEGAGVLVTPFQGQAIAGVGHPARWAGLTNLRPSACRTSQTPEMCTPRGGFPNPPRRTTANNAVDQACPA